MIRRAVRAAVSSTALHAKPVTCSDALSSPSLNSFSSPLSRQVRRCITSKPQTPPSVTTASRQAATGSQQSMNSIYSSERFSDLKIDDKLKSTIENTMKYEYMTKVQAASIPYTLKVRMPIQQ
jgi:hypothetical protein